MKSTVKTYREAAKAHLERAQVELDGKQYYLAHYLSGLAVECHLRAWLRRKTNQFDARHNIERLARESGYYNHLPKTQEDALSAVLGEISVRWRSDHRFFSVLRLLGHFNAIRAEMNSNGLSDRWERLARRLFDDANIIIEQGDKKW
jgi:HEPN domain-containing protein